MNSFADASSIGSSSTKKSGGTLSMLQKSFDSAVNRFSTVRRKTAEPDESGRQLAAIRSSSIAGRVPNSPVATLLSGGRSIHMNGIAKVRLLSKIVNYVPQVGWKRNLVILEEGQLRLTHDLDDIDPSFGKVFSLPDLVDISYKKRGDKQLSLRFWKSNDETRSLDLMSSNSIAQNSIVLQLRTGDAETWVEKILLDLRNQAKLLDSCASMLEDQNQIAGAEILLRQAYDMLSLGCGEYHQLTYYAQQRLVDILNKVGKLEEADDWKCRLEDNKVNDSSSSPDMFFPEDASTLSSTKSKSSRNGLEEMQIFVELSCKAELTDDMVARAGELQRREKQLLEMISSEHSRKVENLSRKAADAESRALVAEQEIQKLRKQNAENIERSNQLKNANVEKSNQINNAALHVQDKVLTNESKRSSTKRSSSIHDSKRKSKGEEDEGAIAPTKLTRNGTAQKSPIKKSTPRGSCYLAYSEASEGLMFFQWSHTDVPSAFACFQPAESVLVPKFKYKQNEGRTEIIRGCHNGSSIGIRKYFDAIAQFVKMGIENKCSEIVFRENGPFPFRIFLFSRNSVFMADDVFSVEGIQGIAVVKKDSVLFDGVATLPKERFLVLGNQGGASLDLTRVSLARNVDK